MYVHTVHTLRIIFCGMYSLLLFFEEDFIIAKLKIKNLRLSEQKNKVKYTYITNKYKKITFFYSSMMGRSVYFVRGNDMKYATKYKIWSVLFSTVVNLKK